MYRLLFLSIPFCFTISTSAVLGGDDLATKIVKYFPGKWEYKDANDVLLGTVDWKAVAGGKCIVGSGPDSGTLAFWDAEKKSWVHVWYAAGVGHGRIEITKFQGDTYYGESRTVDEAGNRVEGKFEMKIRSEDRFEITSKGENSDKVEVTYWYRVKT